MRGFGLVTQLLIHTDAEHSAHSRQHVLVGVQRRAELLGRLLFDLEFLARDQPEARAQFARGAELFSNKLISSSDYDTAFATLH